MHHPANALSQTPNLLQVFTVNKSHESANALWIFEAAKANRGGILELAVPYRLRHVASSSYLTVLYDAANEFADLSLTAELSQANEEATLFLLHPLDNDTADMDSSTPVYLRHEKTGLPGIVTHIASAVTSHTGRARSLCCLDFLCSWGFGAGYCRRDSSSVDRCFAHRNSC